MAELNELNIKQAHEGLKKKNFTSVELTAACLKTIKKVDSDIKAFISVTEKQALDQAAAIDKEIKQGENISLLAGIPYAAKDLFLISGIKTTAGSRILENYTAPYESTTSRRLKKAGAILLGKTNLDEFAMGSSTENSAFGPTKNPRDLERVPGGSSGSSAAVVAANECLFALGTDTGGSIRQPASLCGVVGLKPTYGRTSRRGVVAFASSLDTIGHLTKTVEDAAVVLQQIAGRDEADATTSNVPLDDYAVELRQPIKNVKIGIPKQFFEAEGFNAAVKKAIGQAVAKIEELTGQPVREVELPHSDFALACYYIIMPSEASSNLARYDGIKYGLSTQTGNLFEAYTKTRARGFGAEVKRRIMLGTYALSHGYYDAYYKKALQVRTLVKRDFERAFDQVDVLLAPTTPTTAFKLGAKVDDPLQMYLSDIFTIPASLAGVPALSVPCGEVDGLPVGLQIIGKWFDEKTILRVGHNYEKSGQ